MTCLENASFLLIFEPFPPSSLLSLSPYELFSLLSFLLLLLFLFLENIILDNFLSLEFGQFDSGFIIVKLLSLSSFLLSKEFSFSIKSISSPNICPIFYIAFFWITNFWIAKSIPGKTPMAPAPIEW